MALRTLQVTQKLDLKQTIQQYIYSNSSLRRFCNGNAQRNKIMGIQTVASESSIRKALMSQFLSTEQYEMCDMEISAAESTHNNNHTHLNVGVFRCHQFEQLCVILQLELTSQEVHFHTFWGFATLIINLGIDKWADNSIFHDVCARNKSTILPVDEDQ